MDISKERQQDILMSLGEKFAGYVSATDLVNFFHGQTMTDELNACASAASGDEGAFSDILKEGLIEDEELMELLRPSLAKIIAQDIGAKEVIIVWPERKTEIGEKEILP